MVNNLKLLRIRAGLTQQELADKANIPRCRVSQYERTEDLGNVTIGLLMRVADVLGVTVDSIIYPLPEKDFAENVLDYVSEQHVTSKESAEDGDIDAVINDRFM